VLIPRRAAPIAAIHPPEVMQLRRPPRTADEFNRDRQADNPNEPRINRRIRVPRVLVIDEAGEKLGEFLTEDAIRLAEDRGLDLVEVAPMARPPVCKITDYGKLKYEKKKREQESRRHQVQVVLKEIKLRPKTEEHDLGVKMRAARSFLEEGNKVKFTVRFRGRELAHRDIGAQQCMHLADALKDVGNVETPPRMDGRQMFMVLAPSRRPAAVKPKRREDEQRAIDEARAVVEAEAAQEEEEDDLTDDTGEATPS
jgi:translation initiation factor IF-3